MIDDSTPAADEACDVSNAPTVYTYDTKGVLLQMVVVKESKRLVLDDTRVELEPTLLDIFL